MSLPRMSPAQFRAIIQAQTEIVRRCFEVHREYMGHTSPTLVQQKLCDELEGAVAQCMELMLDAIDNHIGDPGSEWRDAHLPQCPDKGIRDGRFCARCARGFSS